MGFLLPSIIWRALPTEPSVQRGCVFSGVWKAVSVSELSGDLEGTFRVISDSESESWRDSNGFSLTEKSGGSGLLASFHEVGMPWWVVGCGGFTFAIFVYVTSFQKLHKGFWRYSVCTTGLRWGSQ